VVEFWLIIAIFRNRTSKMIASIIIIIRDKKIMNSIPVSPATNVGDNTKSTDDHSSVVMPEEISMPRASTYFTKKAQYSHNIVNLKPLIMVENLRMTSVMTGPNLIKIKLGFNFWLSILCRIFFSQ